MKEEVLDELEALQSLYDDVRILSETCWEIPLQAGGKSKLISTH